MLRENEPTASLQAWLLSATSSTEWRSTTVCTDNSCGGREDQRPPDARTDVHQALIPGSLSRSNDSEHTVLRANAPYQLTWRQRWCSPKQNAGRAPGHSPAFYLPLPRRRLALPGRLSTAATNKSFERIVFEIFAPDTGNVHYSAECITVECVGHKVLEAIERGNVETRSISLHFVSRPPTNAPRPSLFPTRPPTTDKRIRERRRQQLALHEDRRRDGRSHVSAWCSRVAREGDAPRKACRCRDVFQRPAACLFHSHSVTRTT